MEIDEQIERLKEIRSAIGSTHPCFGKLYNIIDSLLVNRQKQRDMKAKSGNDPNFDEKYRPILANIFIDQENLEKEYKALENSINNQEKVLYSLDQLANSSIFNRLFTRKS